MEMNNNSWLTHSLVRNERLLHCGMSALAVFVLFIGIALQKTLKQSVAALNEDKKYFLELCTSESVAGKEVEQLQNQYESQEELYRSLLGRIPNRVVDSEVLSSMRSIAQASQCNLIDFRPGQSQKQNDHQTRSFDLHLEGKFNELFRFFESMSQLPFAYQIGRYKIVESANPGGTCRFDIELKVVFDHAWGNGD